MVELIQVAFIIFLAIFMFILIIIAGVLVLRYLEHRRKTVNYVERNYQSLVEFSKQNCPENIYGYKLERATTKNSEGRDLGTMVGLAELGIELKNSEGQIEEVVKRNFITYRPKELDFNLFNPRSWNPQYRIAIIANSELPFGLNGNTRWEAESVDWYKFYVYSLSDPRLTRDVIATKISDDVKLDFGIKAWEEVGEIARKAAETDAGLIKSIKSVSEFRPRKRD
ncbi:hypothetical protein LCGC14_1163320 [marine sediment metagenome]|uniref:Uncharacterized protein n=1 Tax=marine sediment metagenome TaxID=412755 RepID=A0A0F9LX27_9ZZZZ